MRWQSFLLTRLLSVRAVGLPITVLWVRLTRMDYAPPDKHDSVNLNNAMVPDCLRELGRQV